MAIQNQPFDHTVFLTKLDEPALGLTYSDVVVSYKKQDAISFTNKLLIGSDFQELGEGLYTLKFTAAEMNTLGNFMFKIRGPAFDNFVYDEFDIIPVSADAIAGAAPGVCIISGSLAGIDGRTAPLTKVTFKPVAFPARNNDTIVNNDAVWTFPDSSGNFSVTLIRGATVIIEIQRAAIRSQFVVPDAPTANLIDLLPQFTIDYSNPS